MAEWTQGQVLERIPWTETLCSLRIKAELAPYQAGQFTKLGLLEGEARLQRAYSFVNPPGTPYHEFYLVEIPGGRLSPRLCHLQVGEPVWVTRQATGFLTLEEQPPGRDLWLLSTGTAIGPFLSILAARQVAERFENIVLVHGVRFGRELSYQSLIREFARTWPHRFHYVPFVSREPWPDALPGRIPAAIESGVLEQGVGLALAPATSQVMLCGNPGMVRDTLAVLQAKGLNKHLRHAPGQVTMERYWAE